MVGTTFGKGVIIFISGKAGCGKSTIAEMIKNRMTNEGYLVSITPMATGVKNCAEIFFDWNHVKDERGRKLLQDIGNTGRTYDPDWWVKDALLTELGNDGLFSPDFILVDDWRFPNEIEWARNSLSTEYEVFGLHVVAPEREILKNTKYYDDISETSLDGYDDYDYVFDNSGDIEKLRENVNSFLKEILSKER